MFPRRSGARFQNARRLAGHSRNFPRLAVLFYNVIVPRRTARPRQDLKSQISACRIGMAGGAGLLMLRLVPGVNALYQARLAGGNQ